MNDSDAEEFLKNLAINVENGITELNELEARLIEDNKNLGYSEGRGKLLFAIKSN